MIGNVYEEFKNRDNFGVIYFFFFANFNEEIYTRRILSFLGKEINKIFLEVNSSGKQLNDIFRFVGLVAL